MTFEQNVIAIRGWLESMGSAVDATNARATDQVLLALPRAKDLLVTFEGDEEAKPEQLPAMVLQLADLTADTSNTTSQYKGMLYGTLYLVDEAVSIGECRTKLMRWIDTVKAHCLSPDAIMGSFSRINLRGTSFNIGRESGDTNTLVVRFELAISTLF
jgi:hypothetical protein